MSQRYKGGVISATPPTTSQTAATGVWTLQQQMQAVAASNWPPNGPYFIEDVFSTYLYTGTAGALTITNNINLSGKGGMLWLKNRTTGARNHFLFDTTRGVNKYISSNLTDAETTDSAINLSFSTTGFAMNNSYASLNDTGQNYVSWTFRKQPKFFDVVTYTGNGVSGRTISHNLGSVPGCIIIKRTSGVGNWAVYHRSLNITGGHALMLNATDASASLPTFFNSTLATSTQFTVGDSQATNQDTSTYVAYLFAHDAGGFGTSGSDNVISCGSFTTVVSTDVTVTLGYEPQFVLWKRAVGGTGNWNIADIIRGNSWTGWQKLFANTAAAEAADTAYMCKPTPTGFIADQSFGLGSDNTIIYIAIRRGPMKTPESGTSVFTPFTYSGDNTNNKIQTGFGFPPDLVINRVRNDTFDTWQVDRLRGGGQGLRSYSTAIESAITTSISVLGQDGVTLGSTASSGSNASGFDYIHWVFRRAPGFFDEVCYTGNGNASQLETHNLGVAPELYICKRRNGTSSWEVWSKTPGVDAVYTLALQSTGAGLVNSAYNGYATTTTIEVGGQVASNTSAATYVAYLFSSVAGVSKVGRYTGTGTTKQVDCGFTNGSRFVLIKRTDSTGDWYVWDSARGIVAGNDPYLLLNSTAAEVTNTDYVDTYSAGFELSSTAPAAINANGGTFIFLAIA